MEYLKNELRWHNFSHSPNCERPKLITPLGEVYVGEKRTIKIKPEFIVKLIVFGWNYSHLNKPKQTSWGKFIDLNYTNRSTLPDTPENLKLLHEGKIDLSKVDIKGIDTKLKKNSPRYILAKSEALALPLPNYSFHSNKTDKKGRLRDFYRLESKIRSHYYAFVRYAEQNALVLFKINDKEKLLSFLAKFNKIILSLDKIFEYKIRTHDNLDLLILIVDIEKENEINQVLASFYQKQKEIVDFIKETHTKYKRKAQSNSYFDLISSHSHLLNYSPKWSENYINSITDKTHTFMIGLESSEYFKIYSDIKTFYPFDLDKFLSEKNYKYVKFNDVFYDFTIMRKFLMALINSQALISVKFADKEQNEMIMFHIQFKITESFFFALAQNSDLSKEQQGKALDINSLFQ